MTVGILPRLLLGGGRPGLIRLGLMVIGVAVATTVALIAAVIPVAVGAQNSVAAGRSLVTRDDAPDHEILFLGEERSSSWQGKSWTTVLVASAKNDRELPPGLDRYPRPGEAFVSPAVRTALHEEPDSGARVPATVVGVLRQEGLTGPEDLHVYLGVEAAALSSNARPVVGFGLPVGAVELQVAPEPIAGELLLLVGIPALLFLITCSQLSSATRSRRYAALRLVGMRATRVQRLAGAESAMTALMGALLGYGAYFAVSGPLARSGVLGLSWFPERHPFSFPVLVTAVVATAAAAYATGRIGARGAAKDPLRSRSEPDTGAGSWLRVLPFLLGSSMLFGSVVVPQVFPGSPMPSGTGVVIIFGGALLAVLGLPFALRPMVVRFSGRWADRAWAGAAPVGLRLGLRRLQYEPAGAIRVLTGLVILVLITGVASGVLQELRISGGDGREQTQVTVDPYDLDAEQRAAVFGLPYEARVALTRSASVKGARPRTALEAIERFGIPVVYAGCRDLEVLLHTPVSGCSDGKVYQIHSVFPQDRTELPVGTRIVLRSGGEHRYLEVPSETLSSETLTGLVIESGLLVTSPSPRNSWLEQDTEFQFVVPADQADLVQSKIMSIAPAAEVSIEGQDLTYLKAARMHRGVINAGFVLGGICAIAGFLIGVVDRAVERGKNIAALLVLGTPLRTLRVAQLVQLLFPLSVGLALAMVTGNLGGLSYIALAGRPTDWFVEDAAVMAAVAAGALAVGALSGAVVVGRRLRPEQLRRE